VVNGINLLLRTDSPDVGTDITTLVRRALAEVCTVRVLLVISCGKSFDILALYKSDYYYYYYNISETAAQSALMLVTTGEEFFHGIMAA